MRQRLTGVPRRRSETEIGMFALDMNVLRKKSSVAGVCLGFCLVALTASGWAATTPIYRCLDRNLGLLYTDEPCKDGEQLNIRPGDADPAAVARLEHQRDALDQSASQRLADLRRPAAEGEGSSQSPYEPVDERGSQFGPAYVSGYGIVAYPFMHRHPMRPSRTRLHHVRQFAPKPPYKVPRG
jgi:hypothetical protein